MINLLLITHDTLGDAYLSLVRHFFPHNEIPLQLIRVRNNDDHDTILTRASALLPEDQKTLILTDIFGATPCNAAMKLLCSDRCTLLTGLNAPMLIKAVSRAACTDDLDAFTTCVYQAGIDGILSFDSRTNKAD